MSSLDHSFDWKGFSFFLNLAALCLAVGMGGHYAWTYAKTLMPSAPTTLVAETVPHIEKTSAATLSSTTPQRIINSLTIADTIPETGKFIAADLVAMKLSTYENGQLVAEYPILKKGRPGTPWETPSGFYAIQTKEQIHFSTIGHVYMPYSMQFYGNYFIHGWTYYPDGTPVSASFSGGCIKVSTDDAEKIFAFADVGTKVFVYDTKQTETLPSLTLKSTSPPPIAAPAYLVADIDTGDVFTEQHAGDVRPIASVTKLMTALVANEIISLDKKVTVEEGYLVNPPNPASTAQKSFLVDDLFYPLLMQSSNAIADSLASYYGKHGFINWMNTTAQALDMVSTHFADASGILPDNTSTPDDLFRLATYLSNKKSFVLAITRTQTKTITADDGSTYSIQNVNAPADFSPFDGGKVGHTSAAADTMVSVLSFKAGTSTRRVAVIVLGSDNQARDTAELARWITSTAIDTSEAACVSCGTPPQYRKIQL
ncbi:MAG: L,D-transpeptidase family protein [Patescibacteria group bacterium]